MSMSIPRSAKLLLKLPRWIIGKLLTGLFFVVSPGVPKSKRIWVFGSWYGRRFADNPRYFFLFCATSADCPITPIWISRRWSVVRQIRRLGLRAHHRLSPHGVWYRLRAGVYIIDCRVVDIGPIAPRGTIVVNLWHGVPLKKIERDIEQEHHPVALARRSSFPIRIVYWLLHPDFTERYDFLLGTSPWVAARLASAFGVPAQRVIVAGYPRTDPMLSSADVSVRLLPEERALIDELREHARLGRRVFFYMPTFRDWNNVENRPIPIEWKALNNLLVARGGVLYCKLHPGDQARLPSLAHLPNIRIVPSAVDVYPVLRHTDALITDYSSIYFDYLVLDRPVIFYPYDLADYQRLSRTLYDPYESVTPGPKACTSDELLELIARHIDAYEELSAQWRPLRAQVREQAHESSDGRSSERLLASLLRELSS
jgi:CDP-glycerol glycerophosphotransferase (TagB/SpsB family)